MVCGCAKVRRCENRLLAKQVDSACFRRCLRRACSWASSLIATRSAGGGRPLSTGGITTFLSPASSSSHILSIILLCICSLAKQVGATFRLEACGWFYAAAGRWAANPRLFELYGGEMVLNNCIWCHTSPRRRQEGGYTTGRQRSPSSRRPHGDQTGCPRARSSQAPPRHAVSSCFASKRCHRLSRASLTCPAHTQQTQLKQGSTVAVSAGWARQKVAIATCLPPRASPCRRRQSPGDQRDARQDGLDVQDEGADERR